MNMLKTDGAMNTETDFKSAFSAGDIRETIRQRGSTHKHATHRHTQTHTPNTHSPEH